MQHPLIHFSVIFFSELAADNFEASANKQRLRTIPFLLQDFYSDLCMIHYAHLL
jgi:hypothetical protein